MIMKWLNFNSIIGMAVLSLLFYTENVAAQTDKNDTKQKIDTIQTTQSKYSKYDKRIHRFRKGWNSLIPTHNKIQYAGNMGMFSFGTGWDYGKRDQWETDLFFGFIPKHDSHRAKMTMTLKQNYMPWSLELGKGFSTEQPSRYPEGYYGFSSKIRTHIFLGQRLTYDIDRERRFFAKSVTLFYELSTCDLLLISRVTNSYLRARDYLSLSFGLKFQWL